MSYNRGVIRSLALALLVGAAAAPARAADDADVAREEWKVLGWKLSECSVALELFAYPKLGSGLYDEPVESHVGTLTIPSESEDALLAWDLAVEGKFTWNDAAVKKAEKAADEAGYARKGFAERVIPEVGAQAGLAEILHSTATLATRAVRGFPGPEWRLAALDFSPLSTCALLVYDRRSDGLRHRFRLVRVYDPRARRERARAHTENALLLYAASNLDAAVIEAESGAHLAPDNPVTRYHHAALLTLAGRLEEAMPELEAAIKLDPKYRARARDDADFEALRVRDDFQSLVQEPKP
jgi:tetratricopeptide (TPR) repeat protein